MIARGDTNGTSGIANCGGDLRGSGAVVNVRGEQMNICSTRHDEIVYDARTCPLCEVIDIRDNLEARIGQLESEAAEHECATE